MRYFLLLPLRAVVGDDLGVARVGGLGPKHDRGPARHPENLVEQGELDLAVALATELGPEVGGPKIVVPHFLLHRVDDRP